MSMRTSCLVACIVVLVSYASTHVQAGMEPAHCVGCMNGTATNGCPHPSLCGYVAVPCVNCQKGMSATCPNITACAGVTCQNCMGGMPMDGCPDPATCGFDGFSCIGCVPGVARYLCPHPEWCSFPTNNMTTPPCMDCMMGMAMPYCPDPKACLGLGPVGPGPPVSSTGGLSSSSTGGAMNITCADCIDCMPGMSMPHCPDPNACAPLNCSSSSSSSSSSGGNNGCPGLQCIDCMNGMAMPQCPDPVACNTYQTTGVCPTSISSMPCTMSMVFQTSTHDVCLFFQSWNIDNSGQWFAAFVVILVLAALREGLSVYRGFVHLKRKQEDNLRKLYSSSSSSSSRTKPLLPSSPPALMKSSSGNVDGDNTYDLPSSPSSDFVIHLIDSWYYFLSLILGYLLMLVIMTYNVTLCLFVVCTCFLMHFLFNFWYHTSYKVKYMKRVKKAVQQWKEEHGSGGVQQGSGHGSTMHHDTATGVLVDTHSKPTGGDHCCEDLNFDEI